MEIGRNLHEIKRAIIALQTSDKNDVFTPANWEPGNDVLLYAPDKKDLANPDVYQLSWFLTYKKL
jgi:peroxiredoxin (alkyl hydroperoxide reductase subunit C)